MDTIKRKLNNQRGASVIYAMFLLIAASVICAVTLSAASTQTRRYEEGRAAEQAILTLQSAARLIEDEVRGTASVIEEIYYYEDASTTQTVLPGASVLLKAALKDAVSAYYDDGSFESSSPLTIEADGFAPVTAEFSLRDGEESPQLTFVLSVQGQEAFMTVQLSAYKTCAFQETTTDDELKRPYSSITTTTLHWNKCTVLKGGLQ
ncbi:MAG: hypothetical protein HUJ80_07685 [Firmicutes bacterium]|nr:hypothetical protein [Bacillota bacterium]